MVTSGRRSRRPFYFVMNDQNITIKAGLLLTLRLITYVLISVIVIYWMKFPKVLIGPYLTYSFFTLSLPVIFILKRWLELKFLLRVMLIAQTILEVAVIGSIIYITGNISSAYSALFILTIISIGLVTNLAGTLSIASLISITYASIVWFGLSIHGVPGSSSKALEMIFSSGDAAFYNIFLHILTFFLVAFASGFLVERLKSKDRELADVSDALIQARLDTDDILFHLNSGLLTIDREGRVIYYNRAARDILGFDQAEARGQDFREIFGSRLPELTENLQKVLKTEEQNHRNEITIATDSGNNIPIGISTSLLLGPENNVRGVIAIFRDLTETKALEKKIRDADKMAAVGELSASIAHEIRNPLAAISGSVEVLLGELDLVGENRRLMELIVRESSRLNNILSDFLLYARSKRSAFTRVELCHLVSDVWQVIKHHPSYLNDMSIKLTSSESFVYVFGDEDQIKQILINLIVNACEAVDPEKGEITINIVTEDKETALIEVKDNGGGIDPTISSKLFAPFYSTKKGGTGMGLAIVQRLCGYLNIELLFDSIPGSGSTFGLKFKRAPGLQSLKDQHKASVLAE